MKNLKNTYAVIIISMAFFHAQICSAQYSIWSETVYQNAHENNSIDEIQFTSASDRDGNIYVACGARSILPLETCDLLLDGIFAIKKFSPTGELLTAFDVLLDYPVDYYRNLNAIAVNKTGDVIYVLMTIDVYLYDHEICLAKFRKTAWGYYTLEWSRLLNSSTDDGYAGDDTAYDLVLVEGYAGGHQIYVSGYMPDHEGDGRKYVVYRFDHDGYWFDFYTTTDLTVDGETLTIDEVQKVHLKSVGGRLYAVAVMNHTLTVGGDDILRYDPIIIKFGEYTHSDNLNLYEEHIFPEEDALVDHINQVDIGRNDDVYVLGTGSITGVDNPLTMVNRIKLADGLSWSTYSLPSVPGTIDVQAMKLDDWGDNYLYIAGKKYNVPHVYEDDEMQVLALRRNDGALYSSKTLDGVFDILFSEDVTLHPLAAIQFLVTNNHVYLSTINRLGDFYAGEDYLFVNAFSKNLSEYSFRDIIPFKYDGAFYDYDHYLSDEVSNPKMQYHAGADVFSIIYKYVDEPCTGPIYFSSPLDIKIKTHVDGLFYKEQNEAMLHTAAVELYPNPASEYIELSADTESEIQYKILNAAGMLVGEGKMQQAATIDVKSLAKGLYTIQFFTQDTMMSSEKFIVQ